MADHTSFATFKVHQLPRAFFEADGVETAMNPHLVFGYHHGPIIDPNPNWKPVAWHTAHLATLVCPVVENPPVHQCGQTFESQPDFRRHMRQVHTGCFVNPDRKPISREERVEGQNTLVNYVRSGQWSQDVFMNEPGRGPAAGPIGHYADNLTNIARHDRYWRQGYGSNYHREQQPVTPTSGGRSRRRGQNPPPNPVPFMTPTQLHVADGMSTTPDDSSEEEYISDDNGNEDGNRDGDGNGDSDSDREGTGGGDSADDSAFAPASP
ncbi:hypothetical protein N7532_011293 [Penicillium argentinense]|uniref:C2H2-type domain-containing protein n=1 Tax=Penicillium argentinense TaxID=1131581 RepID=A0A9W9EIA1_9EURO|nr:uncharacterized protein N7532_011293 [Penicillium argentinense]KAJ5082250.1 hypothetical protein N7532_011293 [Penicillium argentinense]